MSTGRSLRTTFTILIFTQAFILTGCRGWVSNPSYFPFLLPSGDIVRTHAKPIGKGYHSNFDPHAFKLVVRPHTTSNPVKKHLVLLATVYDQDGKPRRGRRVEWMVEGAGHIVEVDESGVFNGRGYKVDNRYAISYTDYKTHILTRGNDDPMDDVKVSPGQSWCVITSPVAGDTHVTVYAPGIYDWQKSKVHVTYHWVNCRWTIPPLQTARAGTRKVLTTKVIRTGDDQPLSGYRVRYRLLDESGNVVFAKNRKKQLTTMTDLEGNASAEVAQLRPQRGSTKLAVEILRAPELSKGQGVVLGKGESRIDWLAPELTVKLQGPPTTPIGRQAPYLITVKNEGRIASEPFTVRSAIPVGYEPVTTDPPALKEGDQLIWTLAALPGEQSRDLKVTYRASQVGTIRPRVILLSSGAQPIEDAVTTEITQSDLKLAINAPKTAAVGMPLDVSIRVSNPGTAPAERVVIQAAYDSGLEHERRANPIEMELSQPIAPGKSRDIKLPLIARKAGALKVRVSATSESKLTTSNEATINVQFPQLQVKVSGPTLRYVNRPADWKLTVTNDGQVPLQKVILRHLLSEELSFVEASDRGSFQERQVIWQLGNLGVGERRTVTLVTRCDKVSPASKQRAIVTAEPVVESNVRRVSIEQLQAESEATVEIRGLPAFKLNVVDKDDPVQVGNRTSYRIDVTNQGSLRGTQVEITAQVPKEMKIVRTNGPSEFQIKGQQVKFKPRDGLEPGQTWSYFIDVEAKQAGDARMKVELKSSLLSTPVRSEQSTQIFEPLPDSSRN